MYQPDGQNRFDGRFDFFEWSAPCYETPREIVVALEAMPLKRKVLKGIYLIGYAEQGNLLLYDAIRNAGIDPGENWWETYPHMDKIRMSWEIAACEPLQFVFCGRHYVGDSACGGWRGTHSRELYSCRAD